MYSDYVMFYVRLPLVNLFYLWELADGINVIHGHILCNSLNYTVTSPL